MLLSPICVCRKEQGQGTVSHAGSLCADADSALVSLVCDTHEPCLPSSPRQGLPCADLSCRTSGIFPDPRRSICPRPWLPQPVDFVQSPGRAFCDPAPPLPVFVPLTRDWQKACVASVFRAPKKSDFRCHLVLHAGHQTLLQASGQIYQPGYQTQHS